MSKTQNIGELVGQASTLFYNKKTKLLDGVFDEKQAQEIVDKIEALITEARIDGANNLWDYISAAPKDSWYGTASEYLEKLKENK